MHHVHHHESAQVYLEIWTNEDGIEVQNDTSVDIEIPFTF